MQHFFSCVSCFMTNIGTLYETCSVNFKIYNAVSRLQVITSPFSSMRLIDGRGLAVLEWIVDMQETVGQVAGADGQVSDTSKLRVLQAIHRSAECTLYRDVFSIHPCFTSYHVTVKKFKNF